MLNNILRIVGFLFGFLICGLAVAAFFELEKDSDHGGSIFLLIIGLFLIWYSLPKFFRNNMIDQLKGKAAVISNEQGIASHPFPELVPFESKIDRAIKLGENTKIDFTSIGLTKEKWEYISGKYPQLELPVTHKLSKYHSTYMKIYESILPSILSGNAVSLNKYTAERIKQFIALDSHGKELIYKEPFNRKVLVSGLRYHDYKKKEVKIMLESTDFEELNLERETANEFDIYATKILWKSYLLGYVPREYSREVAELLDEGKKWSVNVYDYKDYGKVAERLEVEIEIERI